MFDEMNDEVATWMIAYESMLSDEKKSVVGLTADSQRDVVPVSISGGSKR